MNMTGSWYSPAYSGEGLDVFEHADGRIVAHFFSYKNNGAQMWLVCSGKRVGKMAPLEAWITAGGHIGNIADLDDVEETPWGKVELSEVAAGLHVWFAPTGKQPWSYTMQSIFDDAPVPTPVPVPPPAPTPAPVPPPAPTTKLKFEVNSGTNWFDTGAPILYGTRKVEERNIVGRWQRARFTVLEGTLTITDIVLGGPHKPRLVGIKEGDVFQVGEGAVMDFYMDAKTLNQDSGWTMTNYQVRSKECDEIVTTSAQVVYS